MLEVLELQFIIFALVGIGYFVRKKFISREGQKCLTELVINIILPCNTLSAFVQDVPKSELYNCLWVFLLSAGIQVFCIIYGHLAYKNVEKDLQKCLAYGIIVSNAGFLGNPLAEGMFGQTGLMLASIYLTPVRIMMWSKGIALFEGTSDRRATLKKVASHPCVIACFLGIGIMTVKTFTGITLIPGPLLSLIRTIGRCNTALSMMVVGMIVSDVRKSDFLDLLVFRYSLERLLLIPAVIFTVMMLLEKTGFISGIVPRLCVLLTAMPAATTTGMLASKYGCAPAFAAKMVVISTILSIPTIFLWSMILA